MTVSIDKQLLIQCLAASLHVVERRSHAVAGDERPGSTPADIVFVIEEKQHPQFSREGNDLVYSARLPLVDALCGATVRLQTLDGRPLTVRCLSLLADAPLHPSCTHRQHGHKMIIAVLPVSAACSCKTGRVQSSC